MRFRRQRQMCIRDRPTTLLLGALGYLFYTLKKELSLDHHDNLENQKENDDLYKDLEDLFI